MTHESVCRQSITVVNENGLHLIPASLITQLARRHECNITLKKGDMTADARNVLDIIALEAPFGTILEIEADGAGAAGALEEVVQLFESCFVVDDGA